MVATHLIIIRSLLSQLVAKKKQEDKDLKQATLQEIDATEENIRNCYRKLVQLKSILQQYQQNSASAQAVKPSPVREERNLENNPFRIG